MIPWARERAIEEPAATPVSVEASTRQWGEKIFALMDAAEPHALFSKKGFYGALMEWAMRDEHFKTQLFRFVDVLPSLTSSAEITRHLREYLSEDTVTLSPAVRLALKASTGAAWLFGAGVKQQVTKLARQFMLGNDEREIVTTLRDLDEQNIQFTVDVLGETVVSEGEADRYAARYLALIDLLAREMAHWPNRESAASSREPARLNVSVKISALYSQIHPADPDTAIRLISSRLRPILRRACQVGAFVNFDMEQYGLKDLTLRLFKDLFSEAEFAQQPACGLALQAYLKSCEADLSELITWARSRSRHLTIRLVKGAYWDYETVIAQQKGWPIPVFTNKAQTDAQFERLCVLLLRNSDIVEAAFGTHNVRTVAHALAQAQRLRLHPRSFEFQMLHGMADSMKAALVKLGCRVREYCPVGELLPGMAYLVRRLLENTSNEGFLAKNFAQNASRDELLEGPHETTFASSSADGLSASPCTEGNGQTPGKKPTSRDLSPALPLAASVAGSSRLEDTFHNEPHVDFTVATERDGIKAAFQAVRRSFGPRHPLIINNQPVQTVEWLPSLNPADQNEKVGYAAQATLNHAETALTKQL